MMNNGIKRFLFLLALSACALPALGQNYPPNIGPKPFSLNGSAQTLTFSGINGQSYCSVTVPGTETMGGGTITIKTTADNGANYFPVTGVPDLGSGTSASSTITVAGTKLSFPVSAQTGFELVLSGATGASINGTWQCSSGAGSLTSNNAVVTVSFPPTQNVTVVGPTGVAPTASAGAAFPAAGVQVFDYPACLVPAGATPNVTGGNAGNLVCDNNGHLQVNVANVGPLPTASTGAAFPGSTPQVPSYPICVVPAGATPNVTGGNIIAVQCQSNGGMVVGYGNNAALATASAGAAPMGIGPRLHVYDNCFVPAGATPNVTGGNAIAVQCDTSGRVQVNVGPTAISPAPNGVAAIGYSSGGADAPVICHSQASVYLATGQATETLLVPSASGKRIHICAIRITGIATAAAPVQLASANTNVCGGETTLENYIISVSTAGVTVITQGTGVGEVMAPVPVGLGLCFNNAASATTNGQTATVIYEQFFRDPDPMMLNDICSVPKRCLLWGLAKRLTHTANSLLDPLGLTEKHDLEP